MIPSCTPLPLSGIGREVRTSQSKTLQNLNFLHLPETGKERDRESGLDYYPARYRDADVGYWISPDAARQFPNLYGYTGNFKNPLNAIDPDGNSARDYLVTPFQIGFYDAFKMWRMGNLIKDEANNWGVANKKSDLEINAYRHALFIATTVKEFGYEDARIIARNHELPSNDVPDTRVDDVNNTITLEFLLKNFGSEVDNINPTAVANEVYPALVTDLPDWSQAGGTDFLIMDTPKLPE